MRYIKFLGVWVLSIVAAVFIPVFTLLGYEYSMEFTLKEGR